MSPHAFLRSAALAAVFSPALLLADAVVTFNEVNYNPATTQDAEWVELHNQMSVNIDISGWSIADGISYTFPSGTVIAAGGYLVVAKNPADPSLTGVSGVLGPFSGSLSNSGENIELLSRSGRVMDSVEFSDTGGWPVAADGAGSTLAKIRPGTASEASANWTASPEPGGTPGARNFAPPGVPIRTTLIDSSSSWRYSDTNVAPAGTWTSTSFNDAAWSTGQALFGTASSTPVLTVTADLTERYRAGAITGVSNGATFTQWSDTATTDGVSQNSTAGGNATYRTNVAGGQPVVRFDGNDEYRTTLSPGIAPASGFVYFVVCKANGTPATDDFIFDRNNIYADEPLASLKVTSGRYQFQKRDDNNGNLGGPVSTTSVSTSQFQIVAIRRNIAMSRFEIWVDGVMEATTTDPGDNLTPQPINIGRHASTVTNGWNGDIAELLVYKSALSDTDFQAVGAYLESRYGLSTAFPNTTVVTPLAAATPTSYFRKSFNFSGDPSRTELRLDQTVADGAVFYLNGQELTRTNMPAGAATHSTSALSDVPQPLPSGFQTYSASSLVSGTNVLAVSLHKAAGDPGAFFAASLATTETPAEPTQSQPLQLNEIAGTGDASFFIELRNASTSTVASAGWTISIAGGASYTVPASSIPGGAVVAFTEAQLGFRPAAGDKIVLRSPSNKIADCQLAAATIGGRGTSNPGQWMRPSLATPGSPNQFSLASNIVINEICYKAPQLPFSAGTPPVSNTISLVSYNSTWRYNQKGANLAAGWAATAHPVGGNWQSGPGSLGYSTTTLPLSLGTTLAAPNTNTPFVLTYYFESDFNLSAANAANLSTLTLSHMIDDGAVIYLNGVELTRFNIPAGAVTSTTLASPGVATAAVVGPVTVTVPPGTAVSGTNRISVEVHQSSSSSSDIVFGMQASATIVTSPGTPEIPEAASTQQWIELYNKGASAVDLSSWKFAAGITYTFPASTILAPGARLVVARDPMLVSPAPGTTLLGPWSGSLSGSGERILLQDAFGNPADEVNYVDGGRWPGTPDGGGSTLELRDPHSDNSIPENWAASDETTRRTWQTYTYQGVAAASTVGPDTQWKEFIVGLLDEGEVLLDDISVIESPSGSPVSMITGGNFESGTAAWRFLGNHSDARIVTDPDNASNHALYLHATGATEHMHNHVETTLAGGLSVVNGRTYQISFKARWISGCNKLNTRLYFNRLPRTTLLPRTQVLGTPGSVNSSYQPNTGPAFTYLNHSPAVPEAGETVTITARAADPDGLGTLTLYYAINGGSYVNTPMTPTGDGTTYTAQVPGQSSASVVRFYVAATDAAGVPATSFFPAEGASAHALYQVNDGLAATNGLNNIRIIMDPVDKALLYKATNVMSNDRIGCTVIYKESEIYYNAGVRLKSSQRGRQNSARVGFNLSFNDDQLFRGVHGTIAIDRSEGQITGAQEILYDHMMYASGGIPAECNDLVKVIAPDPANTSTAILQMARFGNVFLDSQFNNGADGTVYEYELIYYPTTADANGYKLPQPDNVVGVGMTTLGEDKENYRWTYLTKNSEDKDDYSKVIAMAKQFDKSGTDFNSTVNDVLDVDQWLRALAYSCASGAGDSFFVNAHHNGQFYARPSDGRMLYFPHDLDYAYNSTLGIFTSTELQKLVADGGRRHAYLGHLHDICTTVFNQSYMSAWTAHYGNLLPTENFSGHLSYINTRSNYILSAISGDTAPVAFSITTNGGANFTTNDTPVALTGQGWVNVRNIRLAGSTVPLNVTWSTANTWNIVVPIGAGANVINLEAVNFSGVVVGTDSITITNTGSVQLPSGSNIVVSEMCYHPLVPSGNNEYVELQNISSTATIDLSGLTFTGIVFTFPNGATLAPGAKTVVVKNLSEFQSQFGTGRPVAGVFTGSLDNAGETITLRRADFTLVRTFLYDDAAPWPTVADSGGFSIVLIHPFSNPDHSDPMSWRASVLAGGTPGFSDTDDYATWKSNYGNPADNADTDGDGLNTILEYYFGGNPLVADPALAPTFTREPDNALLVSIIRSASVGDFTLVPQASGTLGVWQDVPPSAFVSTVRLPGTPARDQLTFRIPSPNGSERFFVRFSVR